MWRSIFSTPTSSFFRFLAHVRLSVLLAMPPRLPLPWSFQRRTHHSRWLFEHEHATQQFNSQIERRWSKPLSTNSSTTAPVSSKNTPRVAANLETEGTGSSSELDVGEITGVKFRVEPLRRIGEDLRTMRARLLCP